MQGCLDWQKNGLAMPGDVKAATTEYKKDSDVISKFIEDCCEEGADHKISIKNLYEAFKGWAEENADEIMTKKTFGHLLKQRGFKQEKSNATRSWTGIFTKKPSDSPAATESKPEETQAIH